MFDSKDLEAIEDVLFALNKAKYSDVDGNEVIRLYKSFVGLNKLAAKIKQAVEAKPQPVSSKQEEKKEEPVKKPSRKK